MNRPAVRRDIVASLRRINAKMRHAIDPFTRLASRSSFDWNAPRDEHGNMARKTRTDAEMPENSIEALALLDGQMFDVEQQARAVRNSVHLAIAELLHAADRGEVELNPATERAYRASFDHAGWPVSS